MGRTFDVAVAVRQLTSAVLAETDLDQVRSGDVQVAWPEATTFIHLRLTVTAPECDIHGDDSHSFRLYPNQDSPVFYYHLAPRQTGEISIIVTVYQEDDWLGSARIRTMAQQQIAGQVQIDVTSQAMTSPDDTPLAATRRQLRRHHSNLNKLREQASVYALGETPLHLLNQIEEEERIIAELEAQLTEITSSSQIDEH